MILYIYSIITSLTLKRFTSTLPLPFSGPETGVRTDNFSGTYNSGKTKKDTNVRMLTKSKRIELENPSCSGFKDFLICYKT